MTFVVQGYLNADPDGPIKGVQIVKKDLERLKVSGINVSKALHGSNDQLRGIGENAAVSDGAVQNLGYQFNDIGVMLAAGQSPLMLAIQQGSQIPPAAGPDGRAGRRRGAGRRVPDDDQPGQPGHHRRGRRNGGARPLGDGGGHPHA